MKIHPSASCSDDPPAARGFFAPSSGGLTSRLRRWLRRWRETVLVLGCLASIRPTLAGELSAGAAKVDITPSPILRNWAKKNLPYESVVSPLYVRAVVVSDGTDRLAMIQWDLVYARSGAVAKVRQLISAETGIPPDHIMVNASHTHSGPDSPIIDEQLIKEDIESELPAQQDPAYQQWADKLLLASVRAAKAANASLQPVTLAIGRATVPEWQYNRRPRRPDGMVENIFVPEDPDTMPRGLRFGPTDPTLTVLVFKSRGQQTVATLVNYPCHPVSVYSESNAISADWPGFATAEIETRLGGCAVALQGCAGDLVPSHRGIKPARQMGALLGLRTAKAADRSLRVEVGRLQASSAEVGLPLTDEKRAELGRALLPSEVQVFALGPVAVVALPGEPLIEVAQAIQQRSPYPHTIVLGYSNGTGVYYVGLPGEKARGGYEVNSFSGLGTDACGGLLVDTAVRLLHKITLR